MQQDLQHAIWTIVIVQSPDNIGPFNGSTKTSNDMLHYANHQVKGRKIQILPYFT
jgi:hypothetical protein